MCLRISILAGGPGVELEIGMEGEAWEIQHNLRWRKPAQPAMPPLQGTVPTHFRLPEDAAEYLERCRLEASPEKNPQPTVFTDEDVEDRVDDEA